MTRWEYLEVVVWESTGRAYKNIQVERIVANEVLIFDDSKKPTNLFAYLNQLGKDGWELVIRDHNKYYFKRPLESVN